MIVVERITFACIRTSFSFSLANKCLFVISMSLYSSSSLSFFICSNCSVFICAAVYLFLWLFYALITAVFEALILSFEDFQHALSILFLISLRLPFLDSSLPPIPAVLLYLRHYLSCSSFSLSSCLIISFICITPSNVIGGLTKVGL